MVNLHSNRTNSSGSPFFKRVALRRSVRYRRNVKFYGDVVQYTTGVRCVGKRRRRFTKRSKATSTNGSTLSIVSITSNEFKPDSSGKMTIQSLLQLLKHKKYSLPVLRCINKRTGECQIGIPRRNSLTKVTNCTRSVLNKNGNSTNFYPTNWATFRTFQEQVILKNLALMVPFELNPTSLSCDEFRNQMLQMADNNFTVPIHSNFNVREKLNDKYHWM